MATFRTDQIRNVAILGHGGSGKTSGSTGTQGVAVERKIE